MMKYILVILTYFFLFSPILPFFPDVGSMKLLYILLPLIILPVFIKELSRIKSFIYPFLVFFIYVAIRTLFDGYPKYLHNAMVVFIEDVFLSYILLLLHKFFSVNINKTLQYCLLIATFSSVICLFSPSFKTLIETYISMPHEFNGVFLDFRGFGIGMELTYSYGIAIAFLYVYYMFNLDNIKKYHILLLPLVALAILINARTGMLVLSIGLFFLVIVRYKDFSKKVMIPAVLIVFILLDFGFYQYIGSGTQDFIANFLYQVSDTFLGTNYGVDLTAESLTSEYSVLPRSVAEWLFGRGIYIGGHDYSFRADSGYMMELTYGGIIFIMISFWIIINPFFKIGNKSNRLFVIYLFMASVIANFKGPFVPLSLGFKCVSLMLIMFLMEDDNLRDKRYRVIVG